MPDVQMPWTSSYWPLLMKSLIRVVVLAGSQPVATPSLLGSSSISGKSSSAFKDALMAVVVGGMTGEAAHVVDLALPPSFSNSHLAPTSP